MIWKIPRCYDSHVHLLGTGMMQTGLRLFDLQSPSQVSKLKIEKHHFRGEWLVGFGWDQSKWPTEKYPTAKDLDCFFPDFPVAFSRVDGHAVWLNSRAMEMADYHNKRESQKPTPKGGVIVRDENGIPVGIFGELAKIEIDMLIPPYSKEQNRSFLKAAVKYFNDNGFSHIRDMSGFWGQWEILRDMDLDGELSLYIDENFTCENLLDFERALAEAISAKSLQTPHLKSRGIKFYFDGALGSQGAFISQFYAGTNNKGLTLWPLDEVESVIERTWRENLEVSVHTIGDEAAHQVLSCALKIQNRTGLQGILNVEHAEILRPETIAIMKQLNVICHLQPCHWLSDRRWLRTSIPDLYPHVFPWKALEEARIQMQWGSDSPIELASVLRNWKALQDSANEGIGRMSGDLFVPHQHRDKTWGPHCLTTFENGYIQELIFDGKKLI